MHVVNWSFKILYFYYPGEECTRRLILSASPKLLLKCFGETVVKFEHSETIGLLKRNGIRVSGDVAFFTDKSEKRDLDSAHTQSERSYLYGQHFIGQYRFLNLI